MSSSVGHFRAFARLRVSVVARVVVPPQASWMPAQVIDLSLAGARVRVAHALVPGQSAIVQIEAPVLWDPIELSARVAWSRWLTNDAIAEVGLAFSGAGGTSMRGLLDTLQTFLYEQ